MVELSNQYRILYYLYDNYHKKNGLSFNTLKNNDDLRFMPFETFWAEVKYLEDSQYINTSEDGAQLTAKGVKTTELLFTKFIEYGNEYYKNELNKWNGIFNYSKTQGKKILVSQVYFRIINEPELDKIFKKYLEAIVYLDNIESINVKNQSFDTLIINIFLNLEEVNILFENKFGYKIFCPSYASQSTLHKAANGKTINFTDIVATIGSIIDKICHNYMDTLIKQNHISGSINKIKSLLDKYEIKDESNIIEKLRALYAIRSKTFPIHPGGVDVIRPLQKLNINFPINDYKDASYKILENFNLSLLEMKKWFK
jgi:hypothetical protein